MRGESYNWRVMRVVANMGRFLTHLQRAGFSRERQIAFPHKQAWLIRTRREDWEGPAL